MSSSGKMSLVVLRSWSDGPPKVRAIAPPDDDRSIYVPDHKGRFVTEEAKEIPKGEQPPPRCASSASQYKEVSQKDGHMHQPLSLLPESSYRKTADGILYQKTPLQRCFAVSGSSNRHSYSGVGASHAGLTGNLAMSSASLHLPLQSVNSLGRESSSSRPDSATASPDNPDGSSLEYTPPASPVNGRYRNLGPELAATIPKRTMRNNWIAEVKSRWNHKSGNSIAAATCATTTHPSSRFSSRHSAGGNKRASSGTGSTLKSYSSSPSLIYRKNNKSNKGRRGVSEDDDEEDEEEVGDYYDDDNFTLKTKEETPHQHRRSSLQRIHTLSDAGEGEGEQPFFNPLYKFSHNQGHSQSSGNILESSGASSSLSSAASSSVKNNRHTCGKTNGNLSLLRSHLNSAEAVNHTRSTNNLLHRRAASGIALSVDDDSQSDRSRSSLGYPPSNNSGNTSYSPSPPLTSNTPHDDHIYSSLTDIQHDIRSGGRLDPFKLEDTSGHTSDVVLVEVIRKQGKSTGNGEAGKETGNKAIPGVFGDKHKLEKFGSVELIQKLGVNGSTTPAKPKRHSIGEVDPGAISPSKSGQKEGTPGKVARLKESLKRFGRFGRSNTDKLIRAHSDSGFSTDDVHGSTSDLKDFREVCPHHRHPHTRGNHELEENHYENPKEIIVTSLEDTERLGITVKPAPRRRSKPIGVSVDNLQSLNATSIAENIYAVPSHIRVKSRQSTSEDTSSDQTISSPSATPSPQQSVVEEQTTVVADQKVTHDKVDSDKLIERSKCEAKSDRVSPLPRSVPAKKSSTKEEDESSRSIPHLEFDKGDENSTSHDDSCSNSSRAESLTYSSTSHEQDRSMPQQMIVAQHLLPKVDIVCSSTKTNTISPPACGTADDNSSIDSQCARDTLNCEVTPVIPKRTFDEDDQPSSLATLTDAEKDGGDIYSVVINKQQLVRQISNSSDDSVCSVNNGQHTCQLFRQDELKKNELELREREHNLFLEAANKNSVVNPENIITTVQDKKEDEQSSLCPPDTVNESSVPSGNNSGSVAGANNMNSLSRTSTPRSSKISSREISHNGQHHQLSDHTGLYHARSGKLTSPNGNRQHNGPSKTPEMKGSKVEDNECDFNGMGKYEHGTASAQVPVQAVNRHVLGYGIIGGDPRASSCNSILIDDQQVYNESIASTVSKNGSDWNRNSLRASLKGFCADMLQPEQDKLSIPVPDVVEAVINFDEDTSSIEQDDERENSIEYISVTNVKVNRDKALDKLHPRDVIPSCVIALDLGSRGSGYAYWIKEEAEFVRIGNVDGGSSCPASHKAPSWVMFDDLYLDGDEVGESSEVQNSIRPGFGFQALDKYLTDDAHGQLSWKWREHFHAAKCYPYTLDSKASDDDLIFMMKSTIRHYGRQAMEQISQRKKGAPPGPTVILIAIPSTFNQRARQLVRESALESGILGESDSVALIEDSCATGLYSLHALKSRLNKESNSKVTQMSYLSVDCGAAYVHFSGYQVVEGKLRQLILSRSDPLIDSPESLFEAELATTFTPTYIFNYQNKYKAGWLKLMTEFEHAKNRYDPLSKQNYYVFVPSSFVDHFRRFTSMEVEDSLESSDMVWNKTGALGIPHWKMQRFLQPLLDYINDKIVTSMKKHKFDHLVVTGGRAGAKFYVDAVRTSAKGFGATLHVPKEYNAAVLQGSTISVTNLAPRLVIRSRFSIGVGVMTPFSEETHPEEKRVMRDGKSWCADVWDSLIKADQELELNRVIIKRSYVGAQPGQSLLVLPLFKSPDEPKFVTESSVQKCCELKFSSGQRAWQEVELVLVCRPSELLIKAMDGGVMKSYVVVDFAD